jgi:hypothetical protein
MNKTIWDYVWLGLSMAWLSMAIASWIINKNPFADHNDLRFLLALFAFDVYFK